MRTASWPAHSRWRGLWVRIRLKVPVGTVPGRAPTSASAGTVSRAWWMSTTTAASPRSPSSSMSRTAAGLPEEGGGAEGELDMPPSCPVLPADCEVRGVWHTPRAGGRLGARSGPGGDRDATGRDRGALSRREGAECDRDMRDCSGVSPLAVGPGSGCVLPPWCSGSTQAFGALRPGFESWGRSGVA